MVKQGLLVYTFDTSVGSGYGPIKVQNVQPNALVGASGAVHSSNKADLGSDSSQLGGSCLASYFGLVLVDLFK